MVLVRRGVEHAGAGEDHGARIVGVAEAFCAIIQFQDGAVPVFADQDHACGVRTCIITLFQRAGDAIGSGRQIDRTRFPPGRARAWPCRIDSPLQRRRIISDAVPHSAERRHVDSSGCGRKRLCREFGPARQQTQDKQAGDQDTPHRRPHVSVHPVSLPNVSPARSMRTEPQCATPAPYPRGLAPSLR